MPVSPTRLLAALIAFAGLLNTAQIGHAQEATETDLASAQEQLQALMEEAQQQLADEDFESAVTSLSQIVTATRGFQPGPLLMRAKAYAGIEDYASALEDLKNALTYAQTQPLLIPEIQNLRAEIYMELGAFDQALPDLQAATKANRANPIYQFNYGKTLVKLGGADPAEKALTRFLEAEFEELDESMRAEALTYRGQAYGMLRKDEKAAADFEAALAIDPTNHETYFGRASVALQNEEYEKAVPDLIQTIKNYTPEDEEDETPFSQGYLTLAFCQEEVGKEAEEEGDKQKAVQWYDAARKTCNALLKLAPEEKAEYAQIRSAGLFRLGIQQRLLGEYAAAIKSFSRAIRLNPGLGEAYFRRGICFFYIEEEQLAIRDFEQAASINFDSPRSNLWKGMAWAKMGNLNEAIRAYGESISVSDRYVDAYVNRGLAHLMQRDFDKAVADFNEAIRLQPTDAKHYYRRGRSFALAGERDKAIQSLMNAIAFDERLTPAYRALAEVLKESGQWELAEEYRRRANELAQ